MTIVHSGHDNLSMFFLARPVSVNLTAMNLPASLSKVRIISSLTCEPDAKGLRYAGAFLHVTKHYRRMTTLNITI
jgi:hypothetical protein